jgi:hypothetical protein
MTFPWVRVPSEFSAENGGEAVGGHNHHNAEASEPHASAVHKNPVRKAHRALRAAGSTAIVVAGITAYSLAFAASPESDEPARAQWRENMRHKATPGEGCFKASFPAVQWESAPCRRVTGSTHPLPRVTGGTSLTGPQIVGNGADYALVAPGANLITQTVGSFPSVIGVTSESSVGVPAFMNAGILGANEYTLQINTNANATTSACSGGAPSCKVWEQFLYAPDQIVSGMGGVFIQYWLLGYGAGGASCPGGFMTAMTSCFMNSPAMEAPDTPITGLGNLTLTATAASGGNDTVTFFNGTTFYTVTASDSILQIATVWNQSEFNVVGDAGGSEAVFSAGPALNAGLVIKVNVAAQYGSTTAPTCPSNGGTTGETNNLNLLPCTATGGATPSIQFIESLLIVPTIGKAFNPSAIPSGGTSVVTLTLTAPSSGISLTGAAFTDTLVNMSAAGGTVGGSCTGTTPAALSAGATNLSFSGITIPAGASCTVTFTVTSTVPGALTNTASGVSSNEALTGSSSTPATLTVVAPPSIGKSFGAATIPLNGTTTLSFTITNPNAGTALTGVNFSDTLPTGLSASGTATGNCNGGTVTINSGSVSLTGGSIVAGGSCTISGITITGNTAGIQPNSVTVGSTNGGNNPTAGTASVTVVAPPVITKSFTPAKILPGGTSVVGFLITNPNGSVGLTGVAFTDTLPSGLVVTSPNGLNSTCGGTATATIGSGTISLTGGAIAASASCFVIVNVSAPEGIYPNSVQVTSTNGGTGNTSSVTLYVATPPNLSKVFGELSMAPGASTSLSFTLMNPNHVVTLHALQFSDTLPAGLVISTPSVVTGTCGGGTITAPAGNNLITVGSAVLAPQASCTFSINVTSDGTMLGLLTNTTSQVTSTEALPGATASAVVFIGDPFMVSYAANLNVGESYIGIANTGTNGAPLQGPGFGGASGNICVNVYAFDPAEELISCCSCLITPDQTVNLGVTRDLTAKTLTGVVPTSVTLKLLVTLAGPGGAGTTCTNTAATATPATLANGGTAWGTTLHPTAGSFATTERAFTAATLSAGELASISGRCASIIGNGSGFGICSSCKAGALGGANLPQ